MTIHLGRTLRDPVSGLTGVADSYTEFLSGTRQYGIQPAGDGETMPEHFGIDEHLLEVVPSIKNVPATPAPTTVTVELGDEVTRLASGETGIATKKTTFLNGCVYFEVEIPQRFFGLVPSRTVFTSFNMLQVKKKAKVQPTIVKPAAKATDTETPKRAPGGPTTRAPRM